MFSKVLCIFVAIVAVQAAPQHGPPAAQFPAGVNPALCPNYPNCDNALLHNPPAAAHHGGAAHAWGGPAAVPQWHHQAAPVAHWQQPAYNHWDVAPAHWNAVPAIHEPVSNHLPGAGGDKYPAGVNPHACPNYPYCDLSGDVTGHHGHAHHVAPLPGWTERQYPAGVSPHECPNFPYCH